MRNRRQRRKDAVDEHLYVVEEGLYDFYDEVYRAGLARGEQNILDVIWDLLEEEEDVPFPIMDSDHPLGILLRRIRDRE